MSLNTRQMFFKNKIWAIRCTFLGRICQQRESNSATYYLCVSYCMWDCLTLIIFVSSSECQELTRCQQVNETPASYSNRNIITPESSAETRRFSVDVSITPHSKSRPLLTATDSFRHIPLPMFCCERICFRT